MRLLLLKTRFHFLAVWFALTVWLPLSHGQTTPAPGPAESAEPTEKTVTSEPDPCLGDPDCAQLAFHARSMSAAGQHEAALLAYQAAYARRPVPWLLVNIGRLQQKLGRLDDAIITYRKFYTGEGLRDQALRLKARTFVAQALDDLAKQRTSDLPPREVSEPTPAGSIQDGVANSSAVPVEPGHGRNVPLRKQGWFWGVLGAALAGGIGIGIGIGIGVQRAIDSPTETLRPLKM